jgi:hypothetical protein
MEKNNVENKKNENKNKPIINFDSIKNINEKEKKVEEDNRNEQILSFVKILDRKKNSNHNSPIPSKKEVFVTPKKNENLDDMFTEDQILNIYGSNKKNQKFAQGDWYNSPPPSSLPVPSFD